MTYKNRNIFPEESFLAAFLKKKKVKTLDFRSREYYGGIEREWAMERRIV